jgi:hypothetical protein
VQHVLARACKRFTHIVNAGVLMFRAALSDGSTTSIPIWRPSFRGRQGCDTLVGGR